MRKVIFLDEPTSGLDAAAAASIMGFLKETAERMHVAVICTIHQPSTSVFAGFDSVCFLTGGKMAYLGKAVELSGYLSSVGKPVPSNSNPADHMLDLINKDFPGSEVDHMMREWADRAPVVEIPAPHALQEPTRGSALGSMCILAQKHALLMFRDPTVYIGRSMALFAATSFIAFVYLNTRARTQANVTSKVPYLC